MKIIGEALDAPQTLQSWRKSNIQILGDLPKTASIFHNYNAAGRSVLL
jgi:hypothetical protein